MDIFLIGIGIATRASHPQKKVKIPCSSQGHILISTHPTESQTQLAIPVPVIQPPNSTHYSTRIVQISLTVDTRHKEKPRNLPENKYRIVLRTYATPYQTLYPRRDSVRTARGKRTHRRDRTTHALPPQSPIKRLDFPESHLLLLRHGIKEPGPRDGRTLDITCSPTHSPRTAVIHDHRDGLCGYLSSLVCLG